MDNKICNRCGTENQPDYLFCKNCGNALDAASQPIYSPQSVYTETIDGVATVDVAAFVGKAAPKYIPKFCQMEFNRTKVSFNWLFALLTVLVTPFFAPCWFIHKKMYKIGIPLFAVLTVLNLAGIGLFLAMLDVVYAEMAANGYFQNPNVVNQEMFNVILETLVNSTVYGIFSVFNSLTNIITFAVGILGGFFGNYLYKKHAVDTIKSIVAVDEADYKNQVVSRGGTKNVVWIILTVVFIILAITVTIVGLSFVIHNLYNYMVV